MTLSRDAGADEARAIALLQQLASLCEETRRTTSCDPAAITGMLDTFEETLAILAPVFERMGTSPAASRDAVLSAAQYATDSHRALVDSMALELERLARSISEMDRAAHGSAGYAGTVSTATAGTAGTARSFEVRA